MPEDCDRIDCCGDESYGYEIRNASPNPNPVARFLLSVLSDPEDSGTTTGSGEYEELTFVTVSATPNANKVFTGWTGDYEGTENPIQIYMSSDKEVTANFAAQQFYVATSVSPPGSATITGDGLYDYGDTATIETFPAANFSFQSYSGSISTVNNPTDVIVDSDKSIVANLELNQFTVVVSPNPVIGGAPNGSGSYEAGSTAFLSSNPSSDYCFYSYTGDLESPIDPNEVLVDSNKSVVANYVPLPCCAGYAMVLVLDQTGSIGSGGAAAGIAIIDNAFVTALGVVSFGDPYCNAYPITTDLASVRAYLEDAITNPGASPFYCFSDSENGLDSLNKACEMLSAFVTTSPKAIYLKTDILEYNTDIGFSSSPAYVNTQLNMLSKVFLEFGPDNDKGQIDFGLYSESFPESSVITYNGFPSCTPP